VEGGGGCEIGVVGEVEGRKEAICKATVCLGKVLRMEAVSQGDKCICGNPTYRLHRRQNLNTEPEHAETKLQTLTLKGNLQGKHFSINQTLLC
jgi:hypothetical protein